MYYSVIYTRNCVVNRTAVLINIIFNDLTVHKQFYERQLIIQIGGRLQLAAVYYIRTRVYRKPVGGRQVDCEIAKTRKYCRNAKGRR